jgi:hypothetical protein
MESNKPATFRFLLDHLEELNNCEGLVVLDFFNVSIDHLDELSFIKRNLLTIKEVCYIDQNIKYLILLKSSILEENEKGENNYLFIKELQEQNKNIFVENKLNSVHLIIGYSLAKNSDCYIFYEENSQKLFKLNLAKIKQANFDFMKITLEYMLREKKRNYSNDQKGKQPSKLTLFLNNENLHENPPKEEDKLIIREVTGNAKFNQILLSIISQFTKNPPMSFKIIKNTIINYSEQNSNYFFKNFKLKDEVLAFLIFSELVKKNVIINNFLSKLINDKTLTCLEDIDSLLNIYVNCDDFTNDKPTIEQGSNQSDKKIIKKRKKGEISSFTISPHAEEEYKKLLSSCSPICLFVQSVVMKILSNFGLECINRLPTNPGKYRNYVYSFVNNQELLKVSKQIVNIEYEKIVNIITEGIILEFMKNNLVILLSDKKIHYNIQEIEKEKYRLKLHL